MAYVGSDGKTKVKAYGGNGYRGHGLLYCIAVTYFNVKADGTKSEETKTWTFANHAESMIHLAERFNDVVQIYDEMHNVLGVVVNCFIRGAVLDIYTGQELCEKYEKFRRERKAMSGVKLPIIRYTQSEYYPPIPDTDLAKHYPYTDPNSYEENNILAREYYRKKFGVLTPLTPDSPAPSDIESEYEIEPDPTEQKNESQSLLNHAAHTGPSPSIAPSPPHLAQRPAKENVVKREASAVLKSKNGWYYRSGKKRTLARFADKAKRNAIVVDDSDDEEAIGATAATVKSEIYTDGELDTMDMDDDNHNR